MSVGVPDRPPVAGRSVDEREAARPVVSIVIVTYGTGPIVLEAIDAVRAHTSAPLEIIVVDNPPSGGRPATSELLRGRTDIVLLEPDRNLGFGAGNELGVTRAAGDYVCFLNPDAIVGPGWLEPLIAALDDPEVAIAAPVLVNPDGSLQEAGAVLYREAETATIGGPELFPGDETQVFDRDVDYASAACWLVRRDEHVARGGFDLRFETAYFEDVDYALRVEREGRRTRLVSGVRVVHHVGTGGGESNVAVAQVSQVVLRQIWGDRLAEQPSRVNAAAEALRDRDRLAARRTAFVARSTRASPDRRRAAFAEALDLARHRPRERVTFITDGADGLDVSAAPSAGLEVVVGDVDRIVAGRRDDVDTWRQVWSVDRLPWVPAFWAAAVVAVVAVVGVVTRWVLLRSPVGVVNADEAYTGIQGFEILNGNFPIVLGGTVYTWPFESYLYAPLVALFDGGSVALKLLATASWVVASGVAYLAGRDLGSRRAGLIAGSLIWLTTGALLVISVTAYVSYSSGMLVTLTAFWLVIGITGTDVPRHWRPLVFGGLAGLGFWMHPMYVATLVPLVLFVLVVHRRRVSVWVAVIGGGIAGCSPFLAWNARNGWPSLESPTEGGGTYVDRLTTFGRDLLPRAFGFRDTSLEWYLGVGPVLYLALLALVVAGVVVSIRRVTGPPRWLLATVLVAVFPIMALFSAMIFAVDGRYGIIAYPFLVLAVAFAIDVAMGEGLVSRIVAVVAAVAVFWLAGMVLPEVRFLAGIDIGGNPAEVVADRLEEAGFEYVYGSYWQVLPVEYAGARRLTGGVIPVLPVRFPDRQRIVEAQDPVDVAFVFGPAEEDPSRLFMPPHRYERVELAGMIVYLPLPVAEPAG